MKLFGNTHGKNRSARPASRRASDPDIQQNQPREQRAPAREFYDAGREEDPTRQYQPRQAQQARPQTAQPRAAYPSQPQAARPAQHAARPAMEQRSYPAGQRQPQSAQQPARQARGERVAPYSKAAAKYAGYDDYEPYRTEADKRKIEAMIAAYQKKKLIRRSVILIVLVLLVGAGILLWKSWVKPPETERPAPSASVAPSASAGPGDEEVSASPSSGSPYRKDGVYTFLVVGNDDGNGNTDTMLVGSFDTVNEKLNIVSIPRDTLVNVSWSVKKVNTVLAYTDMDGLKEALSRIMGFQVDSYGVIDLDAFVALVNAVDGVDFDVPVDMHYSDPVQNLYININAGYQHLTGEQAVQVVRFRSGYATGDIGRIGTQQAFLKALASKCLSLENLVKNASTYAEIFKTYVDTDLTLGNLIWYLQQFSKLDDEDINFYTLPGNGLESVKGLSYVSIYPDEWVEMINQYLNPLKTDVRVEDLGIMTRDANGNLYMTDGSEMYTNFYDNTGSRGSTQPSSSPAPAESPAPADTPEPGDVPGDAPEVEPDPSGGAEEPQPDAGGSASGEDGADGQAA